MNTIEAETVPPAMAVAVRDANPTELMRLATDVATVCKRIVVNTAVNIQGKKYVKVEGWMSIATAHGCIASSRDVQRVEGGWTAIGEIRRISDGIVLSTAEGFVGQDEKRWKDADEYACRAMAQTRAISRACRAAFAHVVVLMEAGLSTTPAEEIPPDGFENAKQVGPPRPKPAPPLKSSSGPPTAAKPNGMATAAHRERMMIHLVGMKEAGREVANEFMKKIAWLMPNENLEDLPLQFVPATKGEMDSLLLAVQMFASGDDALRPYEPHAMPLASKPTAKPAAPSKPIEVPRDNKPAGEVPDEWFMGVVCPVPHKGETRAEYLKHPDTIGNLYGARHMDDQARARLFGFLYNYQPKGWTKRDGTEMPANEADLKFRDALDAFGKWFEENHPDEVSDA